MVLLGLIAMLGGCTGNESFSGVGTSTSQTTTSNLPTTSTTAESNTATTTPPTSTGDDEPLRLAPSEDWPRPVILYGPDGVFKMGHTGEMSKVVDGPVSAAVDTYLTGVVYQRPGDEQHVFIQGEGPDQGLDQELLVAAENQTVELVGAVIDALDGDTFRVLYVRREMGDPEQTRDTLRSYNMSTGEVSEIYETGGWESGTSFSFIGGRLALGQWYGEASSAIHIVDVVTGRIEQRFPAEGECSDGETGEGCFDFMAATLGGETIYGFGPKRSATGLVDKMALYALDTQTTELTELASFGWDNGLFYANDIWVSGDSVVVSLSTSPVAGEGDPLPALVYNIATGETATTPEAGFIRPAFLS